LRQLQFSSRCSLLLGIRGISEARQLRASQLLG
jgi:hypothetical protein